MTLKLYRPRLAKRVLIICAIVAVLDGISRLYCESELPFLLCGLCSAIAMLFALCAASLGSRRATRFFLVAGAAVVIGSMVTSAHLVEGFEFSPESLMYRKVRYVLCCGRRLGNRTWPSFATPMDDYLRQAYAGRAPAHAVEWDFAYGVLPPRDSHASAFHFYRALDKGDNPEHWLAWSRTHAKQARIVWPAVIRWARKREYYAVGHLLLRVSATRGSSTGEIEKTIDEVDKFLASNKAGRA